MRALTIAGSGILAGIVTCALADNVVAVHPWLSWLPFAALLSVSLFTGLLLAARQ